MMFQLQPNIVVWNGWEGFAIMQLSISTKLPTWEVHHWW